MKIDIRIALIVTGIVFAIGAMVAIFRDVNDYTKNIDSEQYDSSIDGNELGSTIEESLFMQ